MKLHANLTLVLLITVIGFSITACKKGTVCKVLVTVQDSLETPISGKMVNLTCDPTENSENGPCIIDTSGITLTDGNVRFEFANPGILKIFIDGVQRGYVHLEPGEETTKTVIIP